MSMPRVSESRQDDIFVAMSMPRVSESRQDGIFTVSDMSSLRDSGGRLFYAITTNMPPLRDFWL